MPIGTSARPLESRQISREQDAHYSARSFVRWVRLETMTPWSAERRADRQGRGRLREAQLARPRLLQEFDQRLFSFVRKGLKLAIAVDPCLVDGRIRGAY